MFLMDGPDVLRRHLVVVGHLLCTLLAVVTSPPVVRVLEPEFNPAPDKMTFSRGDTARLLCSVNNLGERTVVWRKLPNPNPLTIGLDTWVEDARLHVEHEHKNNQWNLVIEHVTSSDQGNYECQVSMKERNLRQNVVLEVIDVPVKRHPDILISGAQFVTSGGVINLVCNVSSLSDGHQFLQWMKDGNVLTRTYSDGRVSITSLRSHNSPAVSSILKVRDVTVDDAGAYTCRSSDLTHMTSANVNVMTAGSNNVKRAGSMMLENRAVGCLPRDIANIVLVIVMIVTHYLLT